MSSLYFNLFDWIHSYPQNDRINLCIVLLSSLGAWGVVELWMWVWQERKTQAKFQTERKNAQANLKFDKVGAFVKKDAMGYWTKVEETEGWDKVSPR